jgi:hypothetical protein
MYNFLKKIQIAFIKSAVKIHWKQRKPLSADDIKFLKDSLTKDYYIIATRQSNYLTTPLIAFGNWFLTGKWGYFSHVLMNLEDEVKSHQDFRLIEATAIGTKYSSFDEVFKEADSVALITPVNMTLEEWTAALDRAKTYLGTPYDNLFDLQSALEINCVELVRLALSGIPQYSEKFKEFEKLIESKKKLTPDMFVNCSDFKVTCIRKN